MCSQHESRQDYACDRRQLGKLRRSGWLTSLVAHLDYIRRHTMLDYILCYKEAFMLGMAFGLGLAMVLPVLLEAV
jgi:hypothetical protein